MLGISDNGGVSIKRCKNSNKLVQIQDIIISTLTCKLCSRIPFFPLKKHVQANEYYCKTCIEKLPDYHSFKEKVIPPSKLEMKVLESLEISCKNGAYGCDKVFTYRNVNKLLEHEKVCDTVYTKCPAENCNFRGKGKEIESHIDRCELILTTCSRCRQNFEKNLKKFHDCISSLYNFVQSYKEKNDEKIEKIVANNIDKKEDESLNYKGFLTPLFRIPI
jgi:hypothetical protein